MMCPLMMIYVQRRSPPIQGTGTGCFRCGCDDVMRCDEQTVRGALAYTLAIRANIALDYFLLQSIVHAGSSAS